MNEEDKGLLPSATILRINEQARRLPPVLGEFAVQERAQLLERIAEQAREIEDLKLVAMAEGDARDAARAELATLKAQLSGVVLSNEELWSIRKYVAINEVLRDDDSIKICVKHGRAVERAVLARLNQPASAPTPGFVLVPLEPTEAMRIASYVSDVPWSTRAKIYRDMVATQLGTNP